jgi:peptidoglycan/xylan/chitin deacetylase (PgdA/CDA1 family)
MTVPIVTYHAVGDVPNVLWTRTKDFEEHLATFARHGLKTISLGQLADLLARRKPLPKDSFVITFDDGYESVYNDAWPLMKKYGFTATVFLITDFMGKDNHWPGQPPAVPKANLLTWQHVAELAKDGWEFGPHTRSHVALSTVTPAIAVEQLSSSQAAITEHTGQPAKVFAYPYGDTNQSVVDIVKQYCNSAVGTSLGLADVNSNPYLLPRIDSYYLTPGWIAAIHSSRFKQYLKLRQALRTVRRLVYPDYYSSATHA